MASSSRPDPDLCATAAKVCACFHMRRAARAVTRLYDDCLQPVGLKSTQFVILVAIEAEGPITLPRLANVLDVDRSTLTRNLQPLERQGLLQRSGGRGGTSASVRLSRKGRGLLAKGIPHWQRAQEQFESRLGPSRWEALRADLEQVHRASRTT